MIGAMGSFVFGGNPIIIIISSVLCLLGAAGAVAFYKYGYILVPLLTKYGNIVQIIEGGYEIPPSNDVILKNVNGIYYASKFLGVRIFESTSEKTPEENVVYSEYFERAISSVRFPTKFSMMVYVLDLTRHRQKWETQHAEAQLRLAREREKPDPDVLKVDRFEKEVGMSEQQIHRLVSGFKPMGAITYMMTTATGLSKEAAAAAAKTAITENSIRSLEKIFWRIRMTRR